MTTTTPGFTPPYNLEAEQAVLGSILINPDVLDLLPFLLPDDFYREAHGKIFRAILGLSNRHEPVDLQTVTFYLKEVGWLEEVGGASFLAGLSEQVGAAAHAPHYAGIVRGKSQLRRMLTACVQIAGACQEPVESVEEFIDAAEKRIFEIQLGQDVPAIPFSEAVPAEVQRIEELHYKKKKMMGLPSGFVDLDAKTGGFQNSDMIILGARPSMGKTALALNWSLNFGKDGAPGVIFSLEMSKEQLIDRTVATEGNINATRLREAKMKPEEWADFSGAAGAIMDYPIFIVDKTPMTPMEIRAQARRLRARAGIKWVIVDYLQLMRFPKARSREQEVAEISASLKALAKELKIPVIVLCQLNRQVETRDDKRPRLSDLRESGALEQDADVVMFLYRDAYYKKEGAGDLWAELNIAKARNGPTGMVRLTFIPASMRFENYADY